MRFGPFPGGKQVTEFHFAGKKKEAFSFKRKVRQKTCVCIKYRYDLFCGTCSYNAYSTRAKLYKNQKSVFGEDWAFHRKCRVPRQNGQKLLSFLGKAEYNAAIAQRRATFQRGNECPLCIF